MDPEKHIKGTSGQIILHIANAPNAVNPGSLKSDMIKSYL